VLVALPGTASADLSARQEWRTMIAASTAVGLILLFSARTVWLRVLALAIIVAPHLIPAPRPAVEASLAPAELQSQFRQTSALYNTLFWLSLGIAHPAWMAFRKMVSAKLTRETDPNPHGTT
jgi:predicted cobalt transporter CbtA